MPGVLPFYEGPNDESTQDGDAEVAGAELFSAEESAETPAEIEGAGAEEEEAEALFPEEPAAEEEPEAPAKPKDHGRNASWQRIIGQRDQARLERTSLQQKVGELEPLAQAMRDRYAGRGDPVVAMTWDATFLDAFESLSQSDPDVAKAAQKVKQSMEGGQPQQRQAAQTPAAPPRDARVDRLLEREVTRDVQETLIGMGVQERRLEGMSKYIVQHAPDPATLDRATTVALARQYVRENGFKKDELLAGTKPAATPARRPPTGGSRSAPAAAAAEPEVAEPRKIVKPDEWASNRQHLKDTQMRRVFGPTR